MLLHGLVVSVVDHSPLLALFAFFLELEVLLEHRSEAVPLQHPRLVNDLVFIGGQSLEVVEQGHVVALKEGTQNEQITGSQNFSFHRFGTKACERNMKNIRHCR